VIFYGGWAGFGARQVSAAIPLSMEIFERQYERDADAIAVRLMSAAGYDSEAMVRYYRRV
jgi:predicted Zn-dependent protease